MTMHEKLSLNKKTSEFKFKILSFFIIFSSCLAET